MSTSAPRPGFNPESMKANEGTLSEKEAQEYGAHVEGIDMIGILQAKARGLLAQSAGCNSGNNF